MMRSHRAGNLRVVILAGWLSAASAVCAAVVTLAPSDDIQPALASLNDGRLALAEQQALAVTEADRPDADRAWLVVAASRERQGKAGLAIEAYRRFIESCTRTPLRQYAMARMQACRQAHHPPDPVGPVSDRLSDQARRKLSVVTDRTHTAYSTHFIVRANNQPLAELLTAEAERALRRICGALLDGQAFPHVVRVYVWPTAEQFARHATSSPEWAGGSYSIEAADGVLTRRIDLTQLDARGRLSTEMLDRVLPHELCHLVVSELFGDAPCPLMINEGLAMLAESKVDADRVALAAAALTGHKAVPLERLILRRRLTLGDGVDVFYAQAFSFVEFLHSRLTGEQFADFLGHLKAGCSVSDALQRALYLPPEGPFLHQVASAWHDHAIARAQLIEALAAR